MRFIRCALSAFTVLALTACANVQVRTTTLQMVDDVARMREAQVLRNLSAAISDHDMVPTQIFLGEGQASGQATTTAGLKLPQFDFSMPGRELDPGASAQWTATWKIVPVTNADDLRRLRNLYVLLASTDDQYSRLQQYFIDHQSTRAEQPCAGTSASAHALLTPGGAGSGSDHHPALGQGDGQVPRWCDALLIMQVGDSIDCKLYQEQTWTARETALQANSPLDQRLFPFRRWLFWRHPGTTAWLPGHDASGLAVQSLGVYANWEIGVSSRACFNDFVILVQSVTPATVQQSHEAPPILQPVH